MNINTITLAAGNGTRMKSLKPKPLHKIGNLELIFHSIKCFLGLHISKKILVASDELINFNKNLLCDFDVSIQKNKLGTGHAVLSCIEKIQKNSIVIINYADTPFVKKETIEKMIQKISTCDCVFLGFKTGNILNKYGRLILKDEELVEIIEYKDAGEDIKNIDLCNSGIIAIKSDVLIENISKIDNKNASNEYYLTDIVKIIKSNGMKSKIVICDENEVMGVNSRVDLSIAERYFQQNEQTKHMINGVTIQNPDSVYFSHDTKIENDVEIEPNVYFGTGVDIKSGARILAGSYLCDVKIENNCQIGPYARIRGGSEIMEKAIIGNFCEVRSSKIGKSVKAKHLSYIGMAEIGENSNIGAGTVFGNYDGFSKFESKLGRGVFTGVNSSIISPVDIGDGAFIGAGSVITKSVESDAIAIERCEQVNIQNAAKRYREKRRK